jgi:hypothetical protein
MALPILIIVMPGGALAPVGDLDTLTTILLVVLAAAVGWFLWRRLTDNILPSAMVLPTLAAFVSRSSPPASMDQPTTLFVCPLCSEESGERVVILAEYDLSTPLVTVGDLIGCLHAQRFGQVGGLTVDEERRLIDAALAMWEAHQREEGGQAEDDDRADSGRACISRRSCWYPRGTVGTRRSQCWGWRGRA